MKLVEYPRRRRLPLPTRRESTEPVGLAVRALVEVAEGPVVGTVRMLES